ncbi:MAG: PLP-dependent aminotransferase family protein [bacterium]|nr:PLP-dependent aminotransferase family protein [bacterium]
MQTSEPAQDRDEWAPAGLDAGTPIYRAIADALGADVESGRLRPGDRLPTHRDLARRLRVNVMTVSRAYAEAGRRGLVEGEVGRGTFVRRRERNVTRFEPRLEVPEPEATMERGTRPRGTRLVDFHFNLPVGDSSILDATEILEELAGSHRPLLYTGYTTAGAGDHRAAGAEWIARGGLEADPERVLVCGGAQHAMTVTLASLAGPGDLVLTEALTYPGVKALASVLGLRLQGLPMDAGGLLPDAFEAACRKSAPRALYCMPTMQNPTGVVMDTERRRQVAEIARRHGVAIIEDDTYGYLCAEPPAPLSSFAPELGYFLTGTSKNLTAGLRIGYLQAPAAGGATSGLIERLEGNVAALTWMAAPLMAEIAARWIRSGQADAMIRWKRREAATRRRLYERLLGDYPTGSDAGCSHVWLPLPRPWRADDFVLQARRRGVGVTGAETFVVGRATAPHAVRVCLGTPTSREEVERGLGLLAEMLAGAPEVGASIV